MIGHLDRRLFRCLELEDTDLGGLKFDMCPLKLILKLQILGLEEAETSV